MSQPLLSVVATSRNDNHGNDMVHRMQAFVNGFIGQCKRHNLHAELILVEWNPPENTLRLPEVLQWPDDCGPCQIRVIEVPNEIHRRLRYSEQIGLYQMIAKNVGIRRARGKFILVTNIDILFSDELMAFIASGNLRSGTSYRIDRYDVRSPVPVDDVDAQLAHCRSSYIRVAAQEGVFTLTPDGQRTLEREDVTTLDQNIRFEAGWSMVDEYQGQRYRWSLGDARLRLNCPEPNRTLSLRLEPGPGVDYAPFHLVAHSVTGKLIARGLVEPCQRIHLALPCRPGNWDDVILSAENGGKPAPWNFESRSLDFQLLDCRWSDEWDRATAQTGDGSFHFFAQDFGTLADGDIAPPVEGIRFGRGWHGLEHQEGEAFRWCGGSTQLVLGERTPGRRLCLEIEPGPGVEYRPFTLQVHDAHGRLVACGQVSGRQFIDVTLPEQIGSTIVLSALEGGRCTNLTTDKRILDFRAFRVGWSHDESSIENGTLADFVNMQVREVGRLEENDVAPEDAGIRFGSGWHALERYDDIRLRWAGNNARLLIVPPPGKPHSLCLDLEPGAGVGQQPFSLQIQDQKGKVLARGRILGRHRIHVALPANEHGALDLVLVAEEGGRRAPWPRESRVLNFRVFHVGWSDCHDRAKAVQSPDELHLVREEVGYLQDSDVADPEANVRFGLGFHLVAQDNLGHFRLVSQTARLHISEPVSPVLQMVVRRSNVPVRCWVKVNGTALGSFELIDDRPRLVQVPLHGLTVDSLEFHSDSDQPVNPFDPPLRVSRVGWSDEPVLKLQAMPLVISTELDIHDANINLIDGWYDCETTAGVVWRWCGRSATLLAEAPHRAMRMIAFDVEPMRPTTIQFRSGGKVLLRRRVSGRETIRVPWTQGPGKLARIELFAEEEPMRPVNSTDDRLLSFRVFDIRWTEVGNDVRIPKLLRYISRGNNLVKRIAGKLRRMGTTHGPHPANSRTCLSGPVGQPGIGNNTDDKVPAALSNEIVRPPILHTNACGDFTLLSREDWFALKAYPELQIHSFHLDSLFLFITAVAGIREQILEYPMQIFHMEHSLGSGWTPEGAQTHFKRVMSKGIEIMSYEELCARCGDMIRRAVPVNENDDQWGFAAHRFKETVIGSPALAESA